MLVVISPAKNLNFENKINTAHDAMPVFLDKSSVLIKGLKKLSAKNIADLMKLSDSLSNLNYDRYQSWHKNYDNTEAKQAIYAFNGEVYNGLNAQTYTEEDLTYSQSHLRILSGLYGLLKPADLILPYRLEMGTSFPANEKYKNLYAFWQETITKQINLDLKNGKSEYLINLASNEYFKAVNATALHTPVITPIFKEQKGDDYKVVMMYAKKARGLMASYIIKERLKTAEHLKLFDIEGYQFNEGLSNEKEYVFTR